MQLRIDEIRARIAAHNERELAIRSEYYATMKEEWRRSETLEQHLAQFAQVFRTGQPATPADLAEYERAIGLPLPDELREFYVHLGGLRGPCVEFLSLAERLSLRNDPNTPRYRVLRGFGLIDLIWHAWGNDRRDLDPELYEIDATVLRRANERFRSIGWIMDGTEEAHDYVFMDENGNFGTFFYHQDEAYEIVPRLMELLERPSNGESLSVILLRAIP